MRWSRGLDQLLRLDVEEESEEKTSSDTSRNRKGSYWREVHRKSSRIVILVKNLTESRLYRPSMFFMLYKKKRSH